MGKIKDLPNHVSVLLLVEKWDKKWRLGRKKRERKKKTLGAIWVRRCEQLLNVSHENVKRKKKFEHFFSQEADRSKGGVFFFFFISKFRHYLPNSFACAASPFYPACIFFFTCSLYNKDVWQTLTWDLY